MKWYLIKLFKRFIYGQFHSIFIDYSIKFTSLLKPTLRYKTTMRLVILFLLIFKIPKIKSVYNHEPLISEKTKLFLYGNIGSFDDIFSKPLNSYNASAQFDQFWGNNGMNDDTEIEDDVIDVMLFEKELRSLSLVEKESKSLPDLKDYNAITKDIDTRRWRHLETKAGWGGFFLSWMGLYGNIGVWDDSDEYDVEEKKLAMLNACSLQLLLHARFRILQAMRQKNPIRGDKRYMLGYLFNRMRRVLYDSKKVVYIATMTQKYKMKRKVRAMLRLYQQVARYDVDLTDLARYIRKVFQTPADFDRYDARSETNSSYTPNIGSGTSESPPPSTP